MSTPQNESSQNVTGHTYDEAAAGTKALAESISERFADDPLARSATARAPIAIKNLFPEGIVK